jgi:biopolymer transport protein ExbD
MKLTQFSTATQRSPLTEAQFLGRAGSSTRHKKTASFLLPLTSLIDAFSIIVIYLLIGTQAGGLDQDLPKQVNLPVAESGQIIDAEMPTVRIEKGSYYINNEKVANANLAQKLYELKKQSTKDGVEILIQADTAMDYADLDPLLRAGSQAGIQKLKFAVIPTK